jgi:tRNA (guanine-N7-)-methyltransferase
VVAGSPLEIEFGTGKARFLIESARLRPDRRFLGIERSLAYYRIARDRVARSGLANARVVRADAAEAVEHLPPDSVAAFHAYFLDPWPKKKQRKRRLLGERFLSAAANGARSGALFRIITDHEDYGDSIAAAIENAISAGAPWRAAEWESAPAPPPTHYELKYRAAGRTFRRFLLVKI